MSENDTPLHSVLERAADLVEEISRNKGGKNSIADLQSSAELIIRDLDVAYPQLSLIQKTITVVRGLTEDRIDFERTRELARVLTEQQKENHHPSKRKQIRNSSSRRVDAWILDMFSATESAIPRETLVQQFVERYQRERHIQNNEQHGGPWLFVFEKSTDEEDSLSGVRPLFGLGTHPDAFLSRCQEFLRNWQSDPFLGYVLNDGYDIDGWYALPIGGSALFDALIDTKRRMHGEPDYWLNAVYLPGDGRHQSRGVFILYKNTGDPLYPSPPPGQRQDTRLLTVLGLAWRQLEHQMKALARISEEDRRDLISMIAPGLLHHEIGFNMRTAYGQAFEQFNLLQQIWVETKREDIKLAVDYAHGIGRLVLNLYKITDAFNNLDKRGQVENSDLQQIFEEVKILLHHRLGSAHTAFNWNQELFSGQYLHTDVVLLSHALINIINNAINAFEEDQAPPPRCIYACIEKENSDQISISLMNNGPPIPQSETRNIFRRGYTTRRHGHGQGLYLARLVAHYLGGDVQLMERKAVHDDYNVGFRLTINRRLSAQQGVAREID